MLDIKPFQVDRPWGNFLQFNQNSSVTVKILNIKANQELSLQSHEKRSEFWHVLQGDGIIQIEDQKHPVSMGDEQNISIGMKHRLIAGVSGIQILEIATGEFLEEKDEVRYEDTYGRV